MFSIGHDQDLINVPTVEVVKDLAIEELIAGLVKENVAKAEIKKK